MAQNINITNGSGNANVSNGTYSVSATVGGYDNSSILPKSIEIVEGTDEYSLTIGATGTLTIHVTEEGTVDGTPIVGATFKRSDSEGNEYGETITTNAEGNAVFPNVPYAETDAPDVYYIQLTSDGSHEFSTIPVSTTLTEQTSTIQLINALSAQRTFNLYDANYENLPIAAGTITIE